MWWAAPAEDSAVQLVVQLVTYLARRLMGRLVWPELAVGQLAGYLAKRLVGPELAVGMHPNQKMMMRRMRQHSVLLWHLVSLSQHVAGALHQ